MRSWVITFNCFLTKIQNIYCSNSQRDIFIGMTFIFVCLCLWPLWGKQITFFSFSSVAVRTNAHTAIWFDAGKPRRIWQYVGTNIIRTRCSVQSTQFQLLPPLFWDKRFCNTQISLSLERKWALNRTKYVLSRANVVESVQYIASNRINTKFRRNIWIDQYLRHMKC